MAKVKQILREKGHDVWSIGPETSVLDAIAMMAEKEVGALAVTEADKLVGVMTERDYARKVVLQARASRDTPVREIMVWNPVCVLPEQNVEDCMKIMTAKRFRHLPVTENDKLIGIVSIGDVVKLRIAETELEVEAMRGYIASS